MPAPRPRPSRRELIRPLRDFLATEAAGGALLLLAAIVALVWANSPWKSSYDTLWATELSLRFGDHALAMDLHHVVNDGLMTLFFFVVGLEIKRELSDGELRDPRKAALPVVAAIGGMAVPALLFLAVTSGTTAGHGWGVPMATDIAVALGVLQLAAPRIDPSLKLFLLALAIVDDIGAILVIAFFYSSGIRGQMLLGAAAFVTLMLVLRFIGAQSIGGYTALGVVVWWFTYESGVHATIAGVVLGLLAPSRPHLTTDLIDEEALVDVSSVEAARETVAIARQSVSVVEWLEHLLHPWTSFVIVPLFALANAGISLDASSLRDALGSRVALGVVLGLVVGKPLGITAASWLAVRLRVAALPTSVRWRDLAAVAVLGGIGFTVSLFVAGLAFTDPGLSADAKVGILAATVLAGVIGTLALRAVAPAARSGADFPRSTPANQARTAEIDG